MASCQSGAVRTRQTINLICSISLFFFVCPVLLPIANWTVLTYAQAKNNLSNFAYKNFHDMTMVGSSPQLNILVEWHQPGQDGIWRYRVEKGKMVVDVCLPEKTDGSSTKNLVDAMQWAVTKYPAKKYALVLWNHGIGIIDPVWGRMYPLSRADQFAIDGDVVEKNAKIQIDGLTVAHQPSYYYKSITKDKKVFLTQDLLLTPSFCLPSDRRGILFNEHTRTYMDNSALTKALAEIKTKVLKNKKIDVLGMDACLMAMLEVGYQARQYAQYFIASQEVELAHGWNYFAFLDLISQQECSPLQVASNVVDAYGQYYKDRVNFYTQSAVNLEKIDQIKINLDDIVTKLRACRCVLKDQLISVIKKARKSCVQFSATNYIDLHSFLTEVTKHLEGVKAATHQHKALTELLRESLRQGMKSVEEAVVANVTGENFTRARGLSVYFPHGLIDQSYPKTLFAQDSAWLSFIQEACRY
ncbi:MAG: clostripain-related cysteine peptidase [Candidatus Babeliales bacterium]